MLHYGELYLITSIFKSFVSQAAILAAILDFNENHIFGHSKIRHQRKMIKNASLCHFYSLAALLGGHLGFQWKLILRLFPDPIVSGFI